MIRKYLFCAAVSFCSLLLAFSPKENKKINIVFIGDSITQGASAEDPAAGTPPRYAGEDLNRNGRFTAVQVANRGYSGHTTCDFLPSANTDFPKVVEAARAFVQDHSASLVFSIMLGTNDSASSGTNGSPVSANDYRRNLKTIIDALLAEFPDSKFVLQYPSWYSPNTHNGAVYLQDGLARLHSYYPEIDGLVRDYASTKPNQVFAGDKSAFSTFRKSHTELMKPEKGKDGIFYLHPNDAGARMLAKIWEKGILQAVK